MSGVGVALLRLVGQNWKNGNPGLNGGVQLLKVEVKTNYDEANTSQHEAVIFEGVFLLRGDRNRAACPCSSSEQPHRD